MEMFYEFAVEAVVCESSRITYDNKFHAGTGHGDIHTTEVAQESDVPVGIVAHEGNNDNITFLTLETVDSAHGDVALEFAEVVLHLEQAADETRLTAVGGDDAEVDAFALDFPW